MMGDMLCGGVSGKVVVDTFYQRIFGTYHNHVYFFFQGESFQGSEVGSFDSYILATALVPALPGAIKSFSTFGLWAIFHARACSRPPLPNNNIFIFIFRLIYCFYFIL